MSLWWGASLRSLGAPLSPGENPLHAGFHLSRVPRATLGLGLDREDSSSLGISPAGVTRNVKVRCPQQQAGPFHGRGRASACPSRALPRGCEETAGAGHARLCVRHIVYRAAAADGRPALSLFPSPCFHPAPPPITLFSSLRPLLMASAPLQHRMEVEATF